MFVFNLWIWRSLWLLKKNHKFWVEKKEWGGDAEDEVAAVCDMVQAMDFAWKNCIWN